ncbi:MAG: WD40/YVTN/BNR-like repeat-containing protein, partial [Candidatus Kapaibacteriota bacterium]
MYCFEYELTPIKIAFYGAVNAKNNIIVYGDFGSYLLSSDLGKSWEQRFVGVFDEIRSMVNFNDTLFGVMYNGYLIISTDGGVHWILKKLDKEQSERFLNILVTEGIIYIRGIQTIYKLDRNGNVLKSLKNPIFEPTHNNLIEGNSDEVVKPINTYVNDDIYLFEGKIILNSQSFSDSGFIAVDTNLNSFQQVVLINKFQPWSGDYPELVKVLDYSNQKIFLIKYSNLYTTDASFSTFNYFFKDSLFMNFDTVYDVYRKWFKYGNPQLYFTIGDTLFIGKWSDSVKYDTIGPQSYIPYYQFYIYSVNKYIFSGKDTFVVQGKPFYDVYNASHYYLGGDSYKPLLWKIYFPNLIMDDSVWIFVNRNRFVLMTTDKGYSWRLVSYLSGI